MMYTTQFSVRTRHQIAQQYMVAKRSQTISNKLEFTYGQDDLAIRCVKHTFSHIWCEAERDVFIALDCGVNE